MNWWAWIVGRLMRHEVIDVPPDRLSATLTLDSIPARAALAQGLEAVVIDRGVVQASVAATYAPSSLRRLQRQRSNWREPVLLVWSCAPAAVRVVLPAIVSRDGHGFTVALELRLRLAPSCEPGSEAPNLPASAASISDSLRPPLTAVLHERARALEGTTLFNEWPADTEIRALSVEVAQAALGSAARIETSPIVSVTHPFFEAERARRQQLGYDAASLAALEEQSHFRGSFRSIAHREKIDKLQRESDYAAVEAVMQQDLVLRKKALDQELVRADVEAAIERTEHAKRQAEAVIEMIDAASRVQAKLFDSAGQLATHLSGQFDVRFGASAFSAQEREQVQAILTEAARTARSPQEVLSALQRGLPLPLSLCNPFRKFEGAHTVRVGTEWRAFDGETLWKMYVARINTRRHGWFWMKESAASVELRITGRPEGRELNWVVRAEETVRQIGSQALHGRLEQGTSPVAAVRFNCVGYAKSDQAQL